MTGFALGAIVGLILALTGAGGGILAVPLLVFGLHMTVGQAAPIGLLAVGASSALGAVLGLREGIVRYRAAAVIGLVGMALAPLGVTLARHLPNGPLLVAFAFVLAFTARRMWRQARCGAHASAPRPAPAQLPCVLNPSEGRLIWTLPCAWALAATGAVSGMLSGLLGVGGGFVIVPSLTHFTDVPMRSIFATSLAVIALVSIGGIAAAAAHGAIEWSLALPFAAGAVCALLLGRLVAARVAGARLQQSFALVCALVAVLLFARGAGWLTG